MRRQWETRDKTSRRRTHHPTKGNKKGDGRQGETRPREGGHTIQHRQTRGDKTAGRRTHHPRLRHHPSQAHMWETRGDKTSRRRTHRPTQADKTRPHPTQAHMWGDKREDKTSKRRHKCGQTMGDNGLNGREGERRAGEGGHTIQAPWGTRGDQGDKTLKRRAHHPRKGNKKGGGRQWKIQGETRPWEGGHTIQHKRILWGDTGRQRETRGDKTSGRRKCHQADIPSQAHTWGVKTS